MKNTRGTARTTRTGAASVQKSSQGKLIAVVVVAALVIVLALVSAFAWPGWALRHDAPAVEQPSTSQQEQKPAKPSIDATALPDDATELLKAMPDSVLDFARIKADASKGWADASPLEEYTLTYSTGKAQSDVTLEVAQWSSKDAAKKQYDTLAGALKGKELASGSVKVSGDATGSYVVKANESDDTQAVALWQNDTVVFRASGAKDAVERFYQEFPL